MSFGLGFIVSFDGYIFINVYVIDGVNVVMVKLIDKCEYKVKVVGFDK